MKTLRSLWDVRDPIARFFVFTTKHRRVFLSFLSLGFVFLSFVFVYFLFEFYIRNYRIPLTELRKIITTVINKELGRAVDIGVLDFSLREGLILEDLVISQEEDFSFNEHLLKVKKVTFRLSNYFKNTPKVERVDFYGAQLVLGDGDNLQDQLLGYLRTTKVKDIRFHDTRITLKKENSTVLDWKEGWDIFLYRKNKTIYTSYDNGWFWIPNTTRISGEGFFHESDLDEYRFDIKWKNFPSDEALLFTNYLFGSVVHSAVLTGEGRVEKKKSESYVISGNVEFENSIIPLPFFPNFLLDSFRFQEKFYFTNTKEERIFSSFDFLIGVTAETVTAKEPLVQRKIEFKISGLEQITDHITDLSGSSLFPLKGGLKGSFQILETGEKNKWFDILGEIQGSNLEWNSEFLNLRNGDFALKFDENNHWELNLNSEVFDKPTKLNLVGDAEWSKAKKIDGSFYYPMYSKTKGSIFAQSITANDWNKLYFDWKKDTVEEIKERQEKLIPDEYFYQKKVYKYFLESMNFDLAIVFNAFYPYSGAKNLGETKGSLVVRDGRFQLNLPLGQENSKLSLISYYASKTPNLLFSLNLVEYPWSESWMNLCGVDLYPSRVSLDYGFTSVGSDYYTIHKDARVSYSLKLFDVNLKNSDIFTNLTIPKEIWNKPFRLEFDLDHYFETDYIRNMVIEGQNIDIRSGYGSNKSGFFAFSLYGNIGEVRGNFAISEEDNKCTIK
ncbi:hypothetical protein P3G55_09870 [Leptospira sp. 96542]|nr:hypothetical protein [Leptospira sp. 96542]